MSDTSRIDIARIDLATPLQREKYGTLLATGDDHANRFGANVFRDGKPVSLNGCTVTGYFIRPNMNTVVVKGTVSGSTAFVDLPQACYAEQGAFSLAIKVSGNGMTHTLRIVDGYIRTTQTGAIVDPGSVVPSLDDLLAQIDAMEKATAEAKTATVEAVEASKTSAPAIVPTATGGVVAVNDSAERLFAGLTLYGKTTQEGTPSPDAPVPLVNAGNGGSITASVKGKNLLPASAAGTYTKSGITFTSYGDGRYHMSGTAEATVHHDFRLTESVTLPVKCPLTIANNNSVQSYNTAVVAFIGGGVQHAYLAFNTVNRVISYEDGGNYSGKMIDTMRLQVVAGTTIDCDVAPNIMAKTEDTAFAIYKDGGTVTVSTPNALPGIPVSSGGNYTDENGQQWLCDEIDFGRGVYVKRVDTIDSYAGETISTAYMSTTGALTAGATVQYALTNPIETALSADVLSVYAAMKTQYPNTTIMNDAGAGMKLDYIADTKNYIDQRIAALLNA